MDSNFSYLLLTRKKALQEISLQKFTTGDVQNRRVKWFGGVNHQKLGHQSICLHLHFCLNRKKRRIENALFSSN